MILEPAVPHQSYLSVNLVYSLSARIPAIALHDSKSLGKGISISLAVRVETMIIASQLCTLKGAPRYQSVLPSVRSAIELRTHLMGRSMPEYAVSRWRQTPLFLSLDRRYPNRILLQSTACERVRHVDFPQNAILTQES
jgi:hypothetical protein